jgi:hypothetical protein
VGRKPHPENVDAGRIRAAIVACRKRGNPATPSWVWTEVIRAWAPSYSGPLGFSLRDLAAWLREHPEEGEAS